MHSSSRKILPGLALVVVMSACASAPQLPPDPLEGKSYALETRGPKKRIGIVSFENKAPYAKRRRIGESVVDILTTELAKTNAFIVVERAQLDQVLKEQSLGQTGAIDPATAAKAGRVLGLQALVIGSVSEFGVKTEYSDLALYKQRTQSARATVDARVVDATTAQILYATSGTGEFEISTAEVLGFGAKGSYDENLGQIALRTAIVQFMQNLINELDVQEWTGKIVKVAPGVGTAVINAGKELGLQLGTHLAVRQLGETLIDPDTGVELGNDVGPEVGELEVIGYIGTGAAKCKIVSGRGGMKAGDQVSLKK